MASRQCESKTHRGTRCLRSAWPGTDPAQCRLHMKLSEGEVVGNTNPKCLGREGKCNKFAVKGEEYCWTHLPPKYRKELRAKKSMEEMVGKRFADLLDGTISVEDLDEEELARGYPRGPSGGFKSVPPKFIPKSIQDRMVNELFKRSDQMLRESLVGVVQTMTDIATNKTYEPKDRIKAATFIFERLRGKTPDQVVITQDKPFQVVMDQVVAGTRSPRAEIDNVVEAEIVEDEDEFVEWGDDE